jgi:hypothetical protein
MERVLVRIKENEAISVEEVLDNYLSLYISLAKNTGIIYTYLNGLSSSIRMKEATGDQANLDNSYSVLDEAFKEIEKNLKKMRESESLLIVAAKVSTKNTLRNHINFIETYVERKTRILNDVNSSNELLKQTKTTINDVLKKGEKIVALRKLNEYKTRINSFRSQVYEIDKVVRLFFLLNKKEGESLPPRSKTYGFSASPFNGGLRPP